ncbi:helix-turn-helix domain-containing protein [Lactobacillus ultunensis]|uniref:DNA-binding helix-turn-helix protein n=1 Tax=Lactobacillus ultunensis DSM 16047 TaxID=525365 RepID=C2EPA9_9LACO|nr:helix-turn-helix transcriptional regulator [Lactobacillus ultunensis]EEJ71604.1 DNA-binding helix-turn-helix protein [Lactobacillus ultunensis DSM 16047]KRL82461.1 hypothetical protein FC57_GL001891 [Lactobacillus ultunensis DSM 16047]QQP28414.1 helix-turn-helix transcriptional regulator [Lactobacillus ultunensis]
MTIGEALKEERHKLGLTQKEMVKDLLSISEYSKIENNIHNIDANTLFSLLELHNIEIKNFYKKIQSEYLISENKLNLEFITKELEKCFYKNDLSSVKKIKTMLTLEPNVPIELKLKSILILSVLKHDQKAVNDKTKKQFLEEYLIKIFGQLTKIP